MLSVRKDGSRVVVAYTANRNALEPSASSKIKSDRDYTQEAILRAKRVIGRLLRNNPFTHFVTFTFSQKSLDRYGIERYDVPKAKAFLTNYLTRNFNGHCWLLVPELHEDGALHFHGYMQIDSKQLKFKFSNKDRKGHRHNHYHNQQIFDDIGINDFQRISNVESNFSLRYTTKYITKNMDKYGLKAYYFRSRGLSLGQILLATRDEEKIAYFSRFLQCIPKRCYNLDFVSLYYITWEDWLLYLNDWWIRYNRKLSFDLLDISKNYKQLSFFS